MSAHPEPGRADHAHVSHVPTHGSVNPDVNLHDPGQRTELHHHHPLILGAIALGGVIGAEARYGLARAIPHDAGSWPWATLLTNIAGSLLIGVLMALLAAASRPPQLARPFLGVGVLGGFTTFSTYAVDLRQLLGHGHPGLAAAYLLVTLVTGLAAVVAGLRLTCALVPARTAVEVQA